MIGRVSKLASWLLPIKKETKRGLFCFSSKQQKPEHQVKFDEEEIKKKMKQIKERQTPGQIRKEERIQFMTNITNSEAARKVKKYRQSTKTQNLFHFSDFTIEQKPTTLQITGFDDTNIEVDNMNYPPTMILVPKQCLIWQVQSVESLTIDDFIILKYISPKPTYIVIGVQNISVFPASIREELTSKYQNVDILQMFQATSQYNITATDQINVIAFLISK